MSKFTGEIVLLMSEPFLGRVVGGDLNKLEVKFTNGAEDIVSAKDVTFINKAEFLQLLADEETERQAEIASLGDAARPYSRIDKALLEAEAQQDVGKANLTNEEVMDGLREELEPKLAGPGDLVRVKAYCGQWGGRFGIVQSVEMNILIVTLLTSGFRPDGSPVPLQHGDVEIYHIPQSGDEIIVTEPYTTNYKDAKGIIQHSITGYPFNFYVRLGEGPYLGNDVPVFTTIHRREFKIVKKKSGE